MPAKRSQKNYDKVLRWPKFAQEPTEKLPCIFFFQILLRKEQMNHHQ